VKQVLASAAVLVVAVSGCGNDGSSAPKASPTPALPSLASTPANDGISYGLIRATDGKTVIWDPVQFRADACAAGLARTTTHKERFQLCYANPDGALVSAPVNGSAIVRVRPGNGPSRKVKPAELADEIGADAANNVPAPYRVWRLTVLGGTVSSVEQATA
jgi:hypothetical protein